MRFEDEQLRGAEVVRSFMVTSGKATVDSIEELALETRVDRTALGLEQLPREQFERRAILGLLTEPLSIAEISAHLQLPTLSTIVLVTGLVNDELLDAEEAVDEIDMASLMLIRDAIRNL